MHTQDMTTREEAIAAIDTNDFLKRLGVTSVSNYGPHLVGILTGSDNNDSRKSPAERFRTYLWFGPVQGGGASASATREVFTALGRGGECDPRWV